MFAWLTATDVAFAMVAVTQAVMAGLWRVGLVRADAALYQSKQEGRNRVR